MNLRSQCQLTYAAAQRAYSDRLREVLTGVSRLHSWWSALKQSFFRVDSGLPRLSCPDGLVCHNSIEKAFLLAFISSSKQIDDAFPLPSSCDPSILLVLSRLSYAHI